VGLSWLATLSLGDHLPVGAEPLLGQLPEPATVEGTVVEQGAGPAEGVRIDFVADGGGAIGPTVDPPTGGAVTDSTGFFRLEVPAGIRGFLLFRHVGFVDEQMALDAVAAHADSAPCSTLPMPRRAEQ